MRAAIVLLVAVLLVSASMMFALVGSAHSGGPGRVCWYQSTFVRGGSAHC